MFKRGNQTLLKKATEYTHPLAKPLNSKSHFSTTPFRCQEKKSGSNFFNIDLRTLMVSLAVISIGVGSYYSYKKRDRELEYKEKRREERREAIQEHTEILSEKFSNAKEAMGARKENMNERLDKAKNWIKTKRNKNQLENNSQENEENK